MYIFMWHKNVIKYRYIRLFYFLFYILKVYYLLNYVLLYMFFHLHSVYWNY